MKKNYSENIHITPNDKQLGAPSNCSRRQEGGLAAPSALGIKPQRHPELRLATLVRSKAQFILVARVKVVRVVGLTVGASFARLVHGFKTITAQREKKKNVHVKMRLLHIT